jgi:hypothetical protein
VSQLVSLFRQGGAASAASGLRFNQSLIFKKLTVTAMKWIVLEDNPRDVGYVPVIIAPADKKLQMEQGACSVFQNSDLAMDHARQLRERFRVPRIKLFYSEDLHASLI